MKGLGQNRGRFINRAPRATSVPRTVPWYHDLPPRADEPPFSVVPLACRYVRRSLLRVSHVVWQIRRKRADMQTAGKDEKLPIGKARDFQSSSCPLVVNRGAGSSKACPACRCQGRHGAHRLQGQCLTLWPLGTCSSSQFFV